MDNLVRACKKKAGDIDQWTVESWPALSETLGFISSTGEGEENSKGQDLRHFCFIQPQRG